MLNRKVRGTSKRDFKTLRILNINLFSGSSYSGLFKFKRKIYILIACFFFIYLNFILKSYYYYLAVKPLAVNDELGMSIMPVIID